MSAAGTLSTFVWILLIIIIAIILIFVLFKLLDRLFIAPAAYGITDVAPQTQTQEPDDIVDKATVTDNDTKITVTCTENIEGLVESCTG